MVRLAILEVNEEFRNEQFRVKLVDRLYLSSVTLYLSSVTWSYKQVQ